LGKESRPQIEIEYFQQPREPNTGWPRVRGPWDRSSWSDTMFRSDDVNRGAFKGQGALQYVGYHALLALLAMAALCLGASQAALGQAPGVVFSAANGIGGIDNYGSTASHIAANSRGDVFIGAVGSWVSIEEYPAGSSTAVTLVSGLSSNGGVSLTVDAAGNVYAADPGDAKIIFIPLVNGKYPTGATYASLTYCGSSGNFPFASPTQTTACTGFQYLPGSYGYYLQFIDVALDGAGNLYTLSKYTGGSTSSTGFANSQNMINIWSAATGNNTLLASNLPNQGGAEFAVDNAGDIYYVDTTSRSTIQYMAAGVTAVTAGTTTNNALPATFGAGFTQPSGVSIDASGNVYVTDQVALNNGASNQVIMFPNLNGAVSAANQYTLSNAFSTGYSSPTNLSSNHYGPSTGVGIDGYGNIYYAGAYPNSLNEASFGRAYLGAAAISKTTGAQTLNVLFTATVNFGQFVVTGPFAQTSTCSAQQYAANSMCTVSVTYTATAAGPQAGWLVAYDNKSNLLGMASLSGTGQASVLDVDPGTVTALGSAWSSPTSIAMDAAGNAYVADAITGNVYKIAAGSASATVLASGFTAPSAVAVDALGTLYVADSGKIFKAQLVSGVYGTPTTVLSGLSGGTGLAVDANGDVYVADSGNGRVLLLSSSGDQPVGSLVSTVASGFKNAQAITVDNLGNLYVSDAGTGSVLQINLETSQQAIILSGLTTAAGVGVDAAGSLYAADSGSGSISRVPNIGGVLQPSQVMTLASVAAKPSAIAVDAAGNVYVADASDKTVAKLNRNAGVLNLGSVNVLASSAAIAAEASNGGNSALTFNSPFYTAAGAGMSSFAVQSSSTCSAATVNAGAGCTIAAIFTPQSSGLLSETLSLSSNAENSATLVLQGTGASLATTSLALSVTAPAGTPVFGQSVTVKAAVTPGTGPTGSVTFYVDTIAQTPAVTLSGGAASIVLSGLAGGAHNLSASYSGDNTYASSNSSLPLTVAVAATSTSTVSLSATPPLGSNPTSATLGSAITMNATVTPAVAGALTGTVTFLNGSNVLAAGVAVTQAVSGGPGMASYTSSTLTSGTYSITAQYSGDNNFATSSSASGTALQIAAPPANTTSAVFTYTGYVSSVNSAPGLASPDYQGSGGHLAANSRGDVFYNDAPYAYPNSAYLVEIPANGGAQVTLLSGLGYGSGAVYVDAGSNLWAADQNSNIVYIPYVNGSYAQGTVVNAQLANCTAPMSSNTAPCKFYWQLTKAVGYYVQPSDLALDGSGNLYVVDKYDGMTNGGHNRILQFSGVDGSMTIEVDGLPSSGGAQLAVDAGGDVYYADGNGVYFFAASSFPTTTGTTAATSLGTGLSDPTGVALDDGGNLYISDTGNSRLVEIPMEKGKIATANQYTLTSGNQMSSNHAQSGVGIDGYGNIYYVGNYGNSINHLGVGSLTFGSTAIGTASSASTLNLYFIAPATFGSFAVTGGGGGASPFAVGTNGCNAGQTYAAGAECSVSITYTASAAGLQSGSIRALDNNGNLLGQAMLSGSGSAAILNVDPGTVSPIGSGWTAPGAIALDAAGNTYVADATTGKIYKTAAGGTASVAVASGYSSPSAVAIDGAGDLYIADSGNNRIVELPNANGLYGTQIVLASGLKGASGLAIDGVGNLYIADSGNARVLLLSRSGNLQAAGLLSTVGSGFTTPVAVAIDNAGNLYVSDAGTGKVVQVVIPTGQQNTILSGLTTAAGVAVDQNGSLYAADTGTGSITRVPFIGGLLNKNFQTTLGSAVAAPAGIALDSAGNLYATDTTNVAVVEMNRSTGLLNFGNVNVLASSTAISAQLSNGGTAPFAFNTPYYTASGAGTASFAIQKSSTCAAAASVNPGVNCSVAAIFTPQASGVQSEALALSSNAQNSATLNFTGKGTVLTKSTLAIAVVSPSGTPVFGQAVNVSATLTPSAGGTGTPSGTVTFYVDTVPQTPVKLSNDAASYALTTLTGGAHILSASYSGDANYASSTSANLNITIATAPTTTSAVTLSASPQLWANPTSANVGETVTLSATVSNAGVGTPTGSVTFLNGSTVLGSGAVTASGLATLTTTSLTAGNYNITATYLGDSNFSTSSSATSVALLVSAPTVKMTSSSTSITGGGAPVTLTLASIAGFGVGNGSNTVSLACSGLPTYAACSFSPSFAQLTQGQTVTDALAVVVNQPPPIPPDTAGLAALPHIPGRPGLNALLALCLLLPGAILGFAFRRGRTLLRTTLALLLLLGGCVVGTSGCGSASATAFTTPKGTTNFTVTATISPTGSSTTPIVAQTLNFTLTVN
jgi:sugar lactone lactonase YvrE